MKNGVLVLSVHVALVALGGQLLVACSDVPAGELGPGDVGAAPASSGELPPGSSGATGPGAGGRDAGSADAADGSAVVAPPKVLAAPVAALAAEVAARSPGTSAAIAVLDLLTGEYAGASD
jgi:hypothetical protein